MWNVLYRHASIFLKNWQRWNTYIMYNGLCTFIAWIYKTDICVQSCIRSSHLMVSIYLTYNCFCMKYLCRATVGWFLFLFTTDYREYVVELIYVFSVLLRWIILPTLLIVTIFCLCNIRKSKSLEIVLNYTGATCAVEMK